MSGFVTEDETDVAITPQWRVLPPIFCKTISTTERPARLAIFVVLLLRIWCVCGIGVVVAGVIWWVLTFDIKSAGMFAAAYSIFASLFRAFGGWLSDRYGARY